MFPVLCVTENCFEFFTFCCLSCRNVVFDSEQKSVIRDILGII